MSDPDQRPHASWRAFADVFDPELAMTRTAFEPDTALTVNQLVAREPATIAVFNRFGMDTCCGGAVPIADAARRDGVDLDALIAALRSAIAAS